MNVDDEFLIEATSDSLRLRSLVRRLALHEEVWMILALCLRAAFQLVASIDVLCGFLLLSHSPQAFYTAFLGDAV